MIKLLFFTPLFILLVLGFHLGNAQMVISEKTVTIVNPKNKTIIDIVHLSASNLNAQKPILLIFYALPNGNSIEWTKGKKINDQDDWHFAIQHIAAQARFIQSLDSNREVVVVYLSNQQKSWPAWKKQHEDGPAEIKRLVDSISDIYKNHQTEIVLNSHSGGGSFIFGYLEANPSIPDNISRICFIDSDYGYEDSLHTQKLWHWLHSSKKHFLQVLAYNDSVVVYNGKPLVSPTGGTWYRSKLLQQNLSNYLPFKKSVDTAFIRFTGLKKRVTIYLKTNPSGKIYHTEQVARNGFIQTVIGGTRYDKAGIYTYWGNTVYLAFIKNLTQ